MWCFWCEIIISFQHIVAEGQRRYIESLSAYARQFLSKLKNLILMKSRYMPTIAIEQKTKTNNPRSTVSTSTEIYDYLKLMYARIGFSLFLIKKLKRIQFKIL